MEIADVFVVNKADREGAERVVAEIESMLSLVAQEGPVPAIVQTVAAEDRGVDALIAAVEAYRLEAQASGRLVKRRRAHLRRQFEDALRERVGRHLLDHVLRPGEIERTVEALEARALDPSSAAAAVLRRIGIG